MFCRFLIFIVLVTLPGWCGAEIRVTRAFPPVSAGPILLSAGTMVMLEVSQPIDPETIMPGNVVRMRVGADLRQNGKVLIAGGVPASGVVVSVEKIKKKKLVCVTIVAESAQAVDGQTVSLTGAYQAFNIPCCEGPVPMSAGYAVSAVVLNDVVVRP